ncbi:MAG: BadF/BadG/BcrA/BcrD ATPase family protein [Opitutaceae bacterium]
MDYKIGVDGGGTKTECILIDPAGRMVACHVGTGCNPSVVGAEAAASILNAALASLRAQALTHQASATRGLPSQEKMLITDTLLCMAGSRGFWANYAAQLAGFGRVAALDDSRPILELGTKGRPGLVLHAGTGSFVAARGPDNSVHYAGGFGWRLGDPGSGYDIGARAIARTILERQGWALPSRLAPTVLAHAQLPVTAEPSDVTRYFYSHPEASKHIAALAPAILELAGDHDATAQEIVITSTGGLLDLAITVAIKLFSESLVGTVNTGLSGPILNHPFVREKLSARSPMPLFAVADTPIEGVRQLLTRL